MSGGGRLRDFAGFGALPDVFSDDLRVAWQDDARSPHASPAHWPPSGLIRRRDTHLLQGPTDRASRRAGPGPGASSALTLVLGRSSGVRRPQPATWSHPTRWR